MAGTVFAIDDFLATHVSVSESMRMCVTGHIWTSNIRENAPIKVANKDIPPSMGFSKIHKILML